MSKAEKFIQDYTRNCSNEIIVPTLDGNSYTKGYTPWLTPDQARSAIEIAREEIYEWLKKYADTYTWYNEFIGESGMTNDFIDDLKQAIKDEQGKIVYKRLEK